MDKSKGMSQVLTLVVAAGVLMMVALTLMALTSQGGNIIRGVFGSSCVQSIEAQCSPGATITAPNSCFANGNPRQAYINSDYGAASHTPGQEITCPGP